MSGENNRPPRATVIRALIPGMEFRSAEDADLGPGFLGILRVRFSPINEWTEIDSAWEGRFMERFAPGAWKKTIKESARRVKALFQHGQDPQIGDKPLGPFDRLEETELAGEADVRLLDTSYNRDLLPGLQAGLYGASHRFSTVREEEVMEPEPSDYNPLGLPERTIKEARLYELGPVTFPAYEGATAGMRSATDEFLLSCVRSDPDKLRTMLDRAIDLENIGELKISPGEPKAPEAQDPTPPAPSETPDAARQGTSVPERREQGHSALTPSTGHRKSVLDV